ADHFDGDFRVWSRLVTLPHRTPLCLVARSCSGDKKVWSSGAELHEPTDYEPRLDGSACGSAVATELAERARSVRPGPPRAHRSREGNHSARIKACQAHLSIASNRARVRRPRRVLPRSTTPRAQPRFA